MQGESVFRGGVGMKSRTTRAKELRREGWTYQAIADELGVSYGAVHSWINGKSREHTPNPLVDVECAGCGRTLQRRLRKAGTEHRCATCANRLLRRGRTIVCAECGEDFYAAPSEDAKGRKYCSRTCWQKNAGLTTEQYAANSRRMREQRKGTGNPNFKHGRAAGKHISGWSLKDKGEEECRVCARPAEHLHHVVPRSLSPTGRADLRNGLPLCARCHKRWHNRVAFIPRVVFTAEEWAFIETLIGSPFLDERYPSESPKMAA